MKSQNKPTIGLVMIVKDEEKIIKRCLNSVIHIIDEYLIVDTGSSDDTINTIRNFFNEYPHIKGKVISREWKNFGHNRTESFDLGKLHLNVDWFLTIDADMILVDQGFDKNELKSDVGAYQLYQSNHVLKYANIRLMNSKYEWKSIGVTHEYLSSDNTTRGLLKSMYIRDVGDGGSKGDKFERDINLLEQGLIEEPNNSRYKFYLANSYKDTQQWEKAIHWYQERIKDGGWIEEITCSYEYLGLCLEELGRIDEAMMTWLRGYDYNPNRAECIYNAARRSRIDGNNILGYLLIQKAKEIPEPKNDILFVNRTIYESLIDYELSIMAFYNEPNKDFRSLFKELIPKSWSLYNNVISNYKYYVKDIRKFEKRKIDFDDLVGKIEGYHNSSPAIITTEDGYLINLRRVSYEIDKINGAYLNVLDKKPCSVVNTVNTIVKLDKDFKLSEKPSNIFPIDFNEKHVNGLEDIRLYSHNNQLKFTANWWINYEKIQVVNGIYEENLDFEIIDGFNSVEKNWSPLDYEGKELVLYNWSPISFKEISNKKLLKYKTLEKSLPNFRGSTPGIIYKDKIVFLAHCVEYSTPRRYYHSFVVFDKETLEYVDHSKLFTFEGEKIEFTVGMLLQGKELIIAHSIWDSKAYLKFYDIEELFQDLFNN